MVDRGRLDEIIAEVLDGTELRLKLDHYILEESLEESSLKVRAKTHDLRTGEVLELEGEGVGLVDAMFRALKAEYSDEFQSLRTIRFSEFSIRADIDRKHDGSAGSESQSEVTLRVVNSEGREWSFTDVSRSIARSSLNVTLEAVAFFINSERAFVAVHSALAHARQSGRNDSATRYTEYLSLLVNATSYSEVLEAMRHDAMKGG